MQAIKTYLAFFLRLVGFYSNIIMSKIEYFWHSSNQGKPEDYKPYSGKKLLWQCPVALDHVWTTTVAKITEGSNCPYCCGRKIAKSNCLATTHPAISMGWHPAKNSLTPFEVGHGQARKVWWQCEKGHEWQTTIVNRVRYPGCPYCCNQKISIENSILTTHPELVRQWSKKNKLQPSEVSAGSNKKCWWTCEKKHEWCASVNARNQGKGCPFCKNRKLSNTNNLHFKFPQLIAEWHFKKNENLMPDMLMSGSGCKVWWICSKGHEWQATICSRTGPRKTGCPYCYESKGELKISDWLNKNKIPYKRQFKFKECKNKSELRFDFAILPECKILIEYNGQQHYRCNDFFGGKEGLKILQKNDTIKMQFCKKNNLKLLVISYRDFKSINSILEKTIYG